MGCTTPPEAARVDAAIRNGAFVHIQTPFGLYRLHALREGGGGYEYVAVPLDAAKPTRWNTYVAQVNNDLQWPSIMAQLWLPRAA